MVTRVLAVVATAVAVLMSGGASALAVASFGGTPAAATAVTRPVIHSYGVPTCC
jgi:hypothetical protein